MTRYILAWFAMLLIAVANGALRQTTFAKVMPELRAHQLSTLIGSVLIGLFIWFVIRAWPPLSGRQALLMGLVWLVLTVAFELFMGLVLAHRSFAEALRLNLKFSVDFWAKALPFKDQSVKNKYVDALRKAGLK